MTIWRQAMWFSARSRLWLNPARESYWAYTQSTQMIRDQFEDRMYPLTLTGIDQGMRALVR